MTNPNENLDLPCLSLDLRAHWVESGKPEVMSSYDAITRTMCESIWDSNDLIRCSLVSPVSAEVFAKLTASQPGQTGGGAISR